MVLLQNQSTANNPLALYTRLDQISCIVFERLSTALNKLPEHGSNALPPSSPHWVSQVARQTLLCLCIIVVLTRLICDFMSMIF